MIYPVIAYGDPVLRKPTEEVPEDHPDLEGLVTNMWETMYNAPGVGLAAPQVGLSLRIFVVDTIQLFEETEEDGDREFGFPNQEKDNGIKQVFINPIILEEMGDPWAYEEGCLSIPGIREKVVREDAVLIEYYDENFELHEKEFFGISARVIQHEYDHIEGVLFTDKINPIRKRLIKNKLGNISKGKVDVAYKMKFPKN